MAGTDADVVSEVSSRSGVKKEDHKEVLSGAGRARSRPTPPGGFHNMPVPVPVPVPSGPPRPAAAAPAPADPEHASPAPSYIPVPQSPAHSGMSYGVSGATYSLAGLDPSAAVEEVWLYYDPDNSLEKGPFNMVELQALVDSKQLDPKIHVHTLDESISMMLHTLLSRHARHVAAAKAAANAVDQLQRAGSVSMGVGRAAASPSPAAAAGGLRGAYPASSHQQMPPPSPLHAVSEMSLGNAASMSVGRSMGGPAPGGTAAAARASAAAAAAAAAAGGGVMPPSGSGLTSGSPMPGVLPSPSLSGLKHMLLDDEEGGDVVSQSQSKRVRTNAGGASEDEDTASQGLQQTPRRPNARKVMLDALGGSATGARSGSVEPGSSDGHAGPAVIDLLNWNSDADKRAQAEHTDAMFAANPWILEEMPKLQLVDMRSLGHRERLLTRLIHEAARKNDEGRARQLFAECVDRNYRVITEVYNSLLYVLTGGDDWDSLVRGLPAQVADHKQQRLNSLSLACLDVWLHMSSAKVEPDGGTYAGLARLAALRRDAESALRWARRALDENFAPKPRLFTPALVAFANATNVARALEVEELATKSAVDLPEPDYQALLTLVAEHGNDGQIRRIFRRMTRGLMRLSGPTLAIIKRYFRKLNQENEWDRLNGGGAQWQRAAGSGAGADAGGGGAPLVWEIHEGVELGGGGGGFIKVAGASLIKFDLLHWEFPLLGADIADVASRAHHFADFVDWCGRASGNGGYQAVIDAMSVGRYVAETAAAGGLHGAFDWDKVRKVHQAWERQHPNSAILVVVSSHFMSGVSADRADNKAFIKGLKDKGMLYAAPCAGACLRWYTAYAAIRGELYCRLVTNSDVSAQAERILTKPQLLRRWSELHAVRFYFRSGEPRFIFPREYTSCTQQLKNGTWAFPMADADKWLVVKPVEVGGPAAAAGLGLAVGMGGGGGGIAMW